MLRKAVPQDYGSRWFIISEKELAIREYKQALARKNQYITTTNNDNNIWKMAFIILGGGLLIGCFGLLVYSVGYKSGKDKCKYRYKN